MSRLAFPVFPDALLAACLRQERVAQEALYRHFAPRLLGVCLRYARSRAHADDLLQETFLRVFERLPQFRHEGSFDGWMRRVAVTTCLDHFRSDAQRWLQTADLEQAVTLTAEDADALHNLALQDLIHLISTLPDGYRLVLNLYCLEGYSHREIGERLGIDERTSSSQLAKARRLLAERVRRAESVYSDDFLT